LKVTVIGLAVVFLVLILLWIILAVFQLIFKNIANKKQQEAKITTPVVTSAAPNADNSEEELVAIATAAIAAARGESDCAFSVISITKIQK
ncbi:OadG family protein, partial [Eubacteriales bacterium OttesenSCG-928-G02]|nr:OadG family protein [Eubacteriales bacterium OttesenSCG-928-G02]